MTSVRSVDGTQIAFEVSGDGHPVIVVDGGLAYREIGPSRALAQALATRFTAYRYDRRGRGASEDAPEYAVEREVEDIAALIDHAGKPARLVGLSSGGVLALEAANRGLPVSKVVVYEAPFIVNDSRAPFPPDYRAQLTAALSADQPGDAVRLFMRQVGLPGWLLAVMPMFPAWRKLKAIAPTLLYDAAVMGDTQFGKPLPDGRWQSVLVPTLVADGGKSPGWLRAASDALAAVLPIATRRTIAGANHMAQAKLVAPAVTEFVADPA